MIVLDTRALVWWLADQAKLSAAAKKAIKVAANANEIVVSAASILEIATLVRRQRLVLATPLDEWLSDVRDLPELQIEPITMEIAAQAGSFGTDVHGDPVDRLIIATALAFKVPLVTADIAIRELDVIRTVW